MICQSRVIPRLDIPVVADLNSELAFKAYQLSGIPEDRIEICESRNRALQAIERGNRAVLEDASIMMELPVDVVAECTGVPEAGAIHAEKAIRNGKHVVMVNKETDASIGPFLHLLARRAEVVYTAVDGDQHGLLMGLVDWVRELGLQVLCAGKARDREVVYDPIGGTVVQATRSRESRERAYRLSPNKEDVRWLGPVESGRAAEAAPDS
jgi:predicted homoserine dehydrogenase-like protein